MRDEPAIEVRLDPDTSIALLTEAAAEIERLSARLEFERARADRLEAWVSEACRAAGVELADDVLRTLRGKAAPCAERVLSAIRSSPLGTYESMLTENEQADFVEAVTRAASA